MQIYQIVTLSILGGLSLISFLFALYSRNMGDSMPWIALQILSGLGGLLILFITMYQLNLRTKELYGPKMRPEYQLIFAGDSLYIRTH